MDIPLEKIISYNKKDKISKVTKVVITGGPSSGKTECIYKVKEHFEKLGYRVKSDATLAPYVAPFA